MYGCGGVRVVVAFDSPENFLLWILWKSPESSLIQSTRDVPDKRTHQAPKKMEERFDGAEKKKIEKEAREIERTETISSSGASINPTTMPVLHFSIFSFLCTPEIDPSGSLF